MQAASARAALAGVAEPFPGLRPFESDEEPIFRGRQQHTDELLRRLAAHRFLAVVGTSGSGKSSLVRAGLRPALDRGYLAGATSHWRIAMMRPGMAPIENLAEALRHEDALGAADAAKLRSSRLGLVEAVRDAKFVPGVSLLVVADQFEEIFRYRRRMSEVDGGAEAALFVNLLLTAADRPDAPIYVVLTMRSDFLGDCAQFPGLPEALSESQYLIPRLTREQRRQAIEEPLRLFGATMTPQLVEQLLNDSGDEVTDPGAGAGYRGGAPDPLPVLQHALMRTYLEWKSLTPGETAWPIDLAQYGKAGRMASALDRHAERVFTEDLDDGRHWAGRIFRCLTTTELGRPVRRPTLLADLYQVVGAGAGDRTKIDEVLGVLQRSENSFVKVHRDTTVDISHESLIWKWTRLSDWVEKEAAGAELYRDLVKDAKGKATWGEPKLSSALKVREQDGWNADWARQYSKASFEEVVDFLSRSRKAARNQRWLRWFGTAAAVALVILSVVAYYSSRQALQKARELDALTVVRNGLTKDLENRKRNEDALADRINSLNENQGKTQEEQGRNAKERADLEAQLAKSRDDSQKLTAKAQQTTDLLSSVTSLQARLDQALRERDDAVQGRTTEKAELEAQLAKSRDDSQKMAANAQQTADLLASVTSLQARLDQALRERDAVKGRTTPDAASTPATDWKIQTRVNPADGLTYVFIPPGKFLMGCSPGDTQCDHDEKKPPQAEEIAAGFWLCRTEVTQAAWAKVKGGNPSRFKGDQLPVENVDWNEASAYCKAIGGRLPTQKEWEYAARGGTAGARYGSLDAVAWYDSNSGRTTHPVGLKQANAFGLTDMLGNVWEWTSDELEPGLRVLRGGSLGDDSRIVRASYRGVDTHSGYLHYSGFRCVGEFR